ncbi:hypothetical protein WT88_29575 [Burkholderia stagnalis]|nr:hypothetical protein WT35_04515 [Burkholderia stagnalis]KWN32855.1 hypothetical protein WT86_18640 [Burkholderia stagnalis]KWN44682.1 hypothetical protein WT88_29575 [Burkholderia stagnalis]KWN54415.1 hypothetical protein WT87_03670 [Burkholderia stagnalis]KWO68822.1 hypothetical protein WT99_21040 [Burkholderia stagnalis]
MLGLRPKSKRAEDEDENKDKQGRRAEDDDENKDKDAKGGRAEGDDDQNEDDVGTKGSRAEGDEDDEDDGVKGARADDEEDDDAAEDTAEDDGDDKKDDKAKKAARAERRRCARIISHGIKCGNVQQAGVFAFDTGMSSAAAISALNAAASVAERAPKAASLRDRMAAEPRRNPGASSGAATQMSLADQIIAAGKIRRGEQ